MYLVYMVYTNVCGIYIIYQCMLYTQMDLVYTNVTGVYDVHTCLVFTPYTNLCHAYEQ